MARITQFTNDSVIDYHPISFAGTFVRKMRKNKGLANIPSIRTTIAIPRFLTARYWRREKLDPMDYLEAAVYNTPYEDQHIAKKIAYDLLFPKQQKGKKSGKTGKTEDSKSKKDQNARVSGIDEIMDELATAGFDDLLEVMDQDTDIDDLMAEQQDAWEFFEELFQSSDSQDQARLDLLEELDTEYAIVQYHLDQRSLVDTYLKQHLYQMAGTWSPQVFQPASVLGMGSLLQSQAQMPWELATAMAISNHPETEDYLADLIDQADAHTLGTTLQYLRYNQKTPSQQWQDRAFDKIKNMGDFYEMIRGMQQYRDPPKQILEHAGKHDIRNALDLADKINTQFGVDLAPQLFEIFKKQAQQDTPSLQQVQDATYDDGTQSWENLLKMAVEMESKEKSHQKLELLAKDIASHNPSRLTPKMKRAQTNEAKEVASQAMEQINNKSQFLPQLDHLIENGVQPHFKRTVAAGKIVGINEEQIAERFKSPLKVMEAYVQGGIQQPHKYDRIVRKISSVPQQAMQKMMRQAMDTTNTVAIGALGAADLGQAMSAAQGMTAAGGQDGQQLLADCLNKSIGGGTNLLQQWFMHRRKLPKPIKNRLKDLMRDALLEIGMEWVNRGTGSSEEGIIPVNRTRSYRPGDELDLIDIEATLDTLVMSGKTLEQITEDELMVTETSKGRTALGVLIDISGSMSGKNLAMCAIAVVMLLGKLENKEIAIALFESNSHTIKGFEDEVELDVVADELLDLTARGGTRADAALRWMGEEFYSVPDAEVKIMYFLSDFMLSENQRQLTKLCDPMINLDVRILAAYHGRYDRGRMRHMIELLNGNSMQIKDFQSLPKTITGAILSLS